MTFAEFAVFKPSDSCCNTAMKNAFAMLMALSVLIGPCAVAPEILSAQNVPGGALKEYIQHEKELAANKNIRPRSGFNQEVELLFPDLLAQAVHNSATERRHHNLVVSGEFLVHQNSPQGEASIRSIHNDPVIIKTQHK